ncbi:MAG: CCA tRNA nucleotidyltransferase [Planctomycetota bacterium]|nr:CCA tRNA nucleotidyltransferase [Planctomycetota bacterium]
MAKPASKETALWVVRRLRKAGHEAFFAGGSVRDKLMGHESTDYDIATNATPREVKKLFGHVLLVGAKFGVAMVIRDGRKVEVTTFRSDLSYQDGRRPEGVCFATPAEDAQRRDFTINGMFYDPEADQIVDYVGGRDDLQRKVLRTIGRAEDRFGEDYLRMLRAVRFAVRFDFAMDPATASAVRHHAAKITAISGERICEELSKMLSIPSAARALEMLADLGLGEYVLPELFEPGRWDWALRRVKDVAARGDLLLTLAAMLGDLPAADIAGIVRRWGAANDLRDALTWIAGNLPRWGEAADWPLCDFKRMLAHRHSRPLRLLWVLEERRTTGATVHARRVARRAAGIDPRKLLPSPLVTGKDLQDLGVKQGPDLGRIHKALYDAQLNEDFHTRKAAMKAARAMVAAEKK